MPAARPTRQYVVQTGPGITPRPSTDNPRRNSLFIQNTGGVAGTFRLGASCKGDGGDVAFAAGQALLWENPDTCPTESLNFASAAATTWCVIEGIG